MQWIDKFVMTEYFVPETKHERSEMGLFEDLGASELFTGFSQPEIKHLAPDPRPLMLREGEYLFREEEPARSLYIVVFGRSISKCFLI